MDLSYSLALILSTVAAVAITLAAWQRRRAPGAGPLMLIGLAIAVWASTYAVHFLTVSPGARLFWLKVTYLGVVSVPSAFLAFALQYANRGTWLLRKRNIAFLCIEPILTLIILWTDPLHGLFFAGQPPVGDIYDGGPWFWLNVAYSYLLILIGVVLLVYALRFLAPPLRGQAVAILIGAFLPWASSLVGLLGLNPFDNLDLTPFAFTATSVCFAIGLTRYGLLDIVPIARDAIIDNISEAIMVLDTQGRILDLNPTGLRILGWEGQQVVGLLAGEAFPEFRDLFSRFRDQLDTRQEIVLPGEQPRFLDVRISPLYDRKGRFSGRLVVAHDITERRLSEQNEHEMRMLAEALRDTASVLINSRSFDEVLDRILDNVGRVVQHDLASFMLLDEHNIAHVARSRGYREHGLESYERFMHLSVDDIPNFLKMIETGQALVVPDTDKSTDWIAVPGLERLRSYVGAPVRVKGRVVGFLDLTSLTRNYFNQGHANRLQAFADQAAIAIENAGLIEETQRRAEQMTALLEIGQTVTSGLDLERMLQAMLERCKRVLPIEVFYVAVFDPDTGMIEQRLFYDMGEYLSFPPRSLHETPGLGSHILRTRKTLYIPDTLAPEFKDRFPQAFRTGDKPTRCFLGVPMVVGDRAVGIISMQSYEPNAYTVSQIRLLETIATQVAGAIESSRLYDKAQLELAQREAAERSLRKANRRLKTQLNEIEALQAQLREQAVRDPLTGLFNRRYLEEALQREFQRAERSGGTVCLILMDIDGFKGFNDTHGHDAGDFLLVKLGGFLNQEVRRSDISCRYGGEEFLVVMPGAPAQRGHERAEKWRKAFESLDVEHMGVKLKATLSLGVAAYPEHGSSWEQVLHAADRALYAAKAAGKNCTRLAP
jgi:diguanylate cyclase (GGDEF)-like protein/PAS domain S-box-containing protein